MKNTIACPQIAIIRPQGYINASNAAEFQGQLTTAVSSPENSGLLVDMKQVEFLDSAGLVTLVAAHSLAQRLNKRFSLCSVSTSIWMVFELTQLDRVFEVFENRAAFEVANSRANIITVIAA